MNHLFGMICRTDRGIKCEGSFAGLHNTLNVSVITANHFGQMTLPATDLRAPLVKRLLSEILSNEMKYTKALHIKTVARSCSISLLLSSSPFFSSSSISRKIRTISGTICNSQLAF